MNELNPLKHAGAEVLAVSSIPSNPRAVIGGNRQPLEEMFKELNDELPARLEADCAEMTNRTNDLLENSAKVPNTISSVEEEAKATDIASQLSKHRKVVESRRTGIKAGARQAGDIIDGYFKTKGLEPIDAELARIDKPLTAWKRQKAEEERRRREEAERLAREEAERQRAAAAEAARKQREAEEEKRRAEAAAKAAEEAAARAKAEAAAAEARRKQAEIDRAAAEARARAARDEEERNRAAQEAAEAKRRADEEAAAKRKAEEDAAAERARAAAAKTDASLARLDLSDANKEAKTATSLAKQAENDANRAAKAVNAKVSEMSGVRGDFGGQSSLRTVWVGDIINIDKVDLETLRPFLAVADVQKAVNAFVKVNKDTRRLRGVKIYETTDNVIR